MARIRSASAISFSLRLRATRVITVPGFRSCGRLLRFALCFNSTMVHPLQKNIKPTDFEQAHCPAPSKPFRILGKHLNLLGNLRLASFIS